MDKILMDNSGRKNRSKSPEELKQMIQEYELQLQSCEDGQSRSLLIGAIARLKKLVGE